MKGYAKFNANLKGFVLGHGILNHPRIERINGEYRYVGLLTEDGEWLKIMPHQGDNPIVKGEPWLESLGPGKLVFFPDRLPELE